MIWQITFKFRNFIKSVAVSVGFDLTDINASSFYSVTVHARLQKRSDFVDRFRCIAVLQIV